MTDATSQSQLERWVGRMQAALDAATVLGRSDTSAWGAGRVIVGPPATSEELLRVEAMISRPIPRELRRVLSIARSLEAVWHFDRAVEPPPPFDQIFAGGCSWDIDRLAAQYEGYHTWVTEVFPDTNDSYDLVWHDKFPYLEVANGDKVAIDLDGRVVYLSHDDGEGHGYLLGRDVEDFLDRWTSLGCPGPEDWQWLPFVNGRNSLIEPGGEAARAWREWFGLPQSFASTP